MGSGCRQRRPGRRRRGCHLAGPVAPRAHRHVKSSPPGSDRPPAQTRRRAVARSPHRPTAARLVAEWRARWAGGTGRRHRRPDPAPEVRLPLPARRAGRGAATPAASWGRTLACGSGASAFPVQSTPGWCCCVRSGAARRSRSAVWRSAARAAPRRAPAPVRYAAARSAQCLEFPWAA